MNLLRVFIWALVFMCVGRLSAQNDFKRHFMEAAEYVNASEYSKAIEKFNLAISFREKAPNNYELAQAFFYRGYCKSMLNEYVAALKDIEKGIEIKPEYAKAFYFKSEVLFKMKKYEESVEACDAGLRWKPTDAELLMNKWQALEALNRHNDAKNCLRVLLDVNPRNTDALRFVGSSCISMHAWDSAIVYFSKAIDINPLDWMSFYDRGISKSFTNDTLGAEADIRKAMTLDTATKFVGYNNLGFFLKLEQKKYSEAIDFFNKAIALNPDFAYAYSNRAFCKINLGDLQGAHKDLIKSLSLDDSNSYAYKNYGLYYLKTNNVKKACEYFQKSLNLGYSSKYDDEVDRLLTEHCK